MLLSLYKCDDNDKTINKELKYVGGININLRKNVNIENPTLLLNNLEEGVNYCSYKINGKLCYFFIVETESYNLKLTYYTLKQDLLMMYKDEIMASKLRIIRQNEIHETTTNFNFLEETTTTKIESDVVLGDEKIYLITIGG